MPDGAIKLYTTDSTPETPVVFGGSPGGIHVDLWLQNDNDEPLSIHSGSLIAPEVLDPEDPDVDISAPEVVAAHQRELVTLSFTIGSLTPPEAYDAELKFDTSAGELAFPVQIVILQNYQLSVDPDQFVFRASSSDVVSAHVIVRNEGNLPVEVTSMGEFPLRDPWRPVCCGQADAEPPVAVPRRTGLVMAVQRSSGNYSELTPATNGNNKDEFFGSLVIENEKRTLAPGNSSIIRFTARLPDSLPSNAHLRARPRICTERFNIDILTPPETGGQKPKRKPKSPEKGA